MQYCPAEECAGHRACMRMVFIRAAHVNGTTRWPGGSPDHPLSGVPLARCLWCVQLINCHSLPELAYKSIEQPSWYSINLSSWSITRGRGGVQRCPTCIATNVAHCSEFMQSTRPKVWLNGVRKFEFHIDSRNVHCEMSRYTWLQYQCGNTDLSVRVPASTWVPKS